MISFGGTPLQESLQRRNKRTRIRLAFSKGIFHTKLYLFETKATRKIVAWIGSANATAAALKGHNEEILLRLDPAPPSVVEYAKSAWKQSKKLDYCRQSVNSLHAFFRTGVLFYKPYAVLPMTFNPFRSLLDRLPQSEQSKMPTFEARYADTPGIGAFDVRLVYNDEFPGDTDVDDPDSRARPPPVRIRTYGIETCYGYWVAAPFIDDVDEVLRQAASSKHAFLNRLWKWLKGSGRSRIKKAYVIYLADVLRTMDNNKIKWKKHAKPDLFESTDPIEKHVDMLLARLGRDSWCRSYSQPLVSTHVPEFWDDHDACLAFEASFFESLEVHSYSKPQPRAAKCILESIGINNGRGVAKEVIQETMAKQLEDRDWYSREFAGGSIDLSN